MTRLEEIDQELAEVEEFANNKPDDPHQQARAVLSEARGRVHHADEEQEPDVPDPTLPWREEDGRRPRAWHRLDLPISLYWQAEKRVIGTMEATLQVGWGDAVIATAARLVIRAERLWRRSHLPGDDHGLFLLDQLIDADRRPPDERRRVAMQTRRLASPWLPYATDRHDYLVRTYLVAMARAGQEHITGCGKLLIRYKPALVYYQFAPAWRELFGTHLETTNQHVDHA